jgi:hypothetical protein
VTVSFNSGRQLECCVRSVLASSVPVEVTVVDNGSRDDGIERLRAGLAPDETRVRVIQNRANLGFARANNQALAGLTGDFLLLLNPDCTVEPDTIERLQQALAAHPGAGMAGPLIVNPDGSEQAGCRRRRPLPAKALVRAFALDRWLKRLGWRTAGLRDFVERGDELPESPVAVDAISGACMLVRRTALAEIGPLDEGYFLHCEDLDWCERFRRAGRGALFVPGVRVVHDKGGSSRGRPVRVLWHMHRGMVRYYRKFLWPEYPVALSLLVLAGIWLRFGALAALALPRLWLSRAFSR